MKIRRLVLLVAALIGCSESKPEPQDNPNLPSFNADELTQFRPIADGISHSESLVLYEGLPHQEREPKKLAQEFATKKTIDIHGYLFYERAIQLSADEVETLRRVCTSADSFYAGPGDCGSFHPDYALVWNDGDATYEMLVCFGCTAIDIFSHGREKLYWGPRVESGRQFGKILPKYGGQRPRCAPEKERDI